MRLNSLKLKGAQPFELLSACPNDLSSPDIVESIIYPELRDLEQVLFCALLALDEVFK
jgi:hypothetical protein